MYGFFGPCGILSLGNYPLFLPQAIPKSVVFKIEYTSELHRKGLTKVKYKFIIPSSVILIKLIVGT